MNEIEMRFFKKVIMLLYYNLLPFITILIFLNPTSTFAYKMYWKSINSAGMVNERGGTTVGQTSIREVTGESTIGEGSYGFWYYSFAPELCFNISPNYWDLDTVNFSETISMEFGEHILVENCSNCRINLGFRFSECLPDGWSIGISPWVNQFTLRAHFTENPSPPAAYEPTTDCIGNVDAWSDGIYFGSPGYNLGVLSSVYLWFQFLSPTETHDFSENTITVYILAQVNLP